MDILNDMEKIVLLEYLSKPPVVVDTDNIKQLLKYNFYNKAFRGYMYNNTRNNIHIKGVNNGKFI